MLLAKLAEVAWENREDIWRVICIPVDWWNGKNIAIIGPPGVGKTSFYQRLQGKPVPNEHRQTKNPQNVKTFTFKRILPDQSVFKLKGKKCVDLGGEEESRSRHWLETCRKAHVIFYLISVHDLIEKRTAEGSRIDQDCAWLAGHLGKMQPDARIHFLVNKIDLEISGIEQIEGLLTRLAPEIGALETRARVRFGDYANRLTGISPMSMANDELFEFCLPLTLTAVYDALHPAK